MEEESMSMRPFVQVATICQTAITDVHGFLTIVRVMDRVPLMGITDEMTPQPLNQLAIVVVLKAGPMRGQYKWSITPVTPTKKRLPPMAMSALFEGDERGVALVSPLPIVVEEEGLYWFEVRVEQELLTQIPLRVMYQKIQMPGMPFQAPPPDSPEN